MGGGNGQKAKMARKKNMEKQKAAKGSQLESNKKAMTIQMLDGLMKRVALDFDVQGITKEAKASKESKISEVGADIELLIEES